jgi:hypothetical protein
MSDLILGGTFTTPPYSMISGIDEALSRKYHKHIGKSGKIWLVSNELACAENIYVDGGAGSRGFAGRTMTFELVDGSTVNLIGPWCSNTEALFVDTGIDVRDKFYTWGCIGTSRSGNGISNLIYFDTDPVLGTFNRIETLAKQLSEERQQCLYYYSQTRGGSTLGPVNYNKFNLPKSNNI